MCMRGGDVMMGESAPVGAAGRADIVCMCERAYRVCAAWPCGGVAVCGLCVQCVVCVAAGLRCEQTGVVRRALVRVGELWTGAGLSGER